MLKEIDIPPLWLGLALAATWALSALWSVRLLAPIGKVLVILGLGLMGWAVVQMLLARTTFIPRRNPQALVTRGVFAISRNPIYLGDVAVLLGAALYWGAVLALPLVAVFVWWITQRYILDEEARLRAGFGTEFEAWCQRVPRWIIPVAWAAPRATHLR